MLRLDRADEIASSSQVNSAPHVLDASQAVTSTFSSPTGLVVDFDYKHTSMYTLLGRQSLMMRFLGLCSYLVLLGSCAAHTVEIGSQSKDCFFEDLHKGDQMTLAYQVASGNPLEIDVTLTAPNGARLLSDIKKDTNSHGFTADQNGRYVYCFLNEGMLSQPKSIAFGVHGIIYVEDDGKTQPVEREILALAQNLRGIKDEQAFLLQRERIHRNSQLVMFYQPW